MITFSIIIPTYNSAKTLDKTLVSIAAQTYRNLEVIVMDGGSKDTTIQLVNTFKDRIPNLNWFSEPDDGIYDAMNKGLAKVSGEWVLFLGSDDTFYQEDVLQNVVAEMNQKKASKVFYGNAKIIGDTGWASDGDIYDGPFDLPKLLNQNICHQAIFYDAQFITSVIGLFNLNYPKSSDWDFNLRCWAKAPFEYMDIIVANFAAGGFSTQSTDKTLTNEFLDNVLNYFKIDLFHPLVDNSNFKDYRKVKRLQLERHPVRSKWNRWKSLILKKLSR